MGVGPVSSRPTFVASYDQRLAVRLPEARLCRITRIAPALGASHVHRQHNVVQSLKTIWRRVGSVEPTKHHALQAKLVGSQEQSRPVETTIAAATLRSLSK